MLLFQNRFLLAGAILGAAVTAVCGQAQEVLLSKPSTSPNLVPWNERHDDLNAIYFATEEQGWAVGRGGVILASRDGGASWVRQTSGLVAELEAVHFIDSSRGWSVGASGSVVATKNGGLTWVRQSSSTDVHLKAVAFIDAVSGWAVGAAGTMLRTTDAGATWIPSSLQTNKDLADVFFLDEERGWAVGNGIILRSVDGGTTWHAAPKLDEIHVESVYFTSPNEGWVVGRTGKIFSSEDGGVSWTPHDAKIDADLLDVFFASGEVGWVVGSGGTVLTTDNAGETWATKHPRTNQDLRAVFFKSVGVGWIVGDDGTILLTESISINCFSEKTRGEWDFQSVNFPSSENGWAVGLYGTIVSTVDAGRTWVSRNFVDQRFHLQSVYFPNETVGWAVGYTVGLTVGQEGAILSTKNGGKDWKKSHTENALSAVYFNDDQHGWIVGKTGTILVTVDAGLTWKEQTSGTTSHLESIHFVTDSDGWVVGRQGSILATTDGGVSWSPQESGTAVDLSSVYFVDAEVGWAVGEGGTILDTRNGGRNWSPEVSGVRHGLSAVQFRNRRHGWVVGEGDLLVTTDGGRSWIAQETCTGQPFPSMSSIFFTGAEQGFALGSGGEVIRCSRDEAPYAKKFEVDETQSAISWTAVDDCAVSEVRCNLSFRYSADHGWLGVKESISPYFYEDGIARFSVDWQPGLSRVRHGDRLRYRIELSDRSGNMVVQDVPGVFPYGSSLDSAREWWLGLILPVQLLVVVSAFFLVVQSILLVALWVCPACLLFFARIDFPEIDGGNGFAGVVFAVFRFLMIVTFVDYFLSSQRFLNSLVKRHGDAVSTAFVRASATCGVSFRDPCPPVTLDDVEYSQLSPELLKDLYGARLCQLIIGPDRAVNLRIACQIASWAGCLDEEQRLLDHCMLPILIENNTKFDQGDSIDPFVVAIHGKLEAMTGTALPLKIVRSLLRERRILAIVDCYSDMTAASQSAIRPERPGFFVYSLIITSESEAGLGGVPCSIIRPR